MPRGRRLRQFQCDTCMRGGRLRVWWAMVPNGDPRSECRGCGNEFEAILDGEWVGVGACLFQCDECKIEPKCDEDGPKPRMYTVLCEWTDTAKCYGCGKQHSPIEFKPPRRIKKKTENVHSCSKCNGCGDCPNFHSLHIQRP